MAKVRVGLVGLGMMGATHLKAWREGESAEVTAVCDIRPERLEGDLSATLGNIDTGAAGQQDFARVRKYKTFGAMARSSEVDVVDVCVPTFLHARMTVQALRAGKHVFCEKPMALNVRQAVKMVQAARATGRFVMVGHVLRFWPEYLMLKEMIDSGRYGHVQSATFRRFSPVPRWAEWFLDPKQSGGAPLDLHVHDADVVQWFFGTPSRVCSQGAADGDGRLDHIITQYEYDAVSVVVAEAGWNLPASYPFWMGATIVFETAAVVFNSIRSPSLAVYEAGAAEAAHPPVPQVNAYAEELKYFAECVASGTAPRRVSAEDAARAVGLVEAEVRSARTRRPVPVKF